MQKALRFILSASCFKRPAGLPNCQLSIVNYQLLLNVELLLDILRNHLSVEKVNDTVSVVRVVW